MSTVGLFLNNFMTFVRETYTLQNVQYAIFICLKIKLFIYTNKRINFY